MAPRPKAPATKPAIKAAPSRTTASKPLRPRKNSPKADAEVVSAKVAVAKAPGVKAPSKGVAPARRAIGRPAGAGNGVGRELLLQTACELLKTTQPAKLTRFKVAQHANVDPSLIRYYFRDRLSLLAAAAERLSDEYLARAKSELEVGSPTGLGRLDARLSMDLSLDATYSHFRRLLMEELLVSEAPAARAVASRIMQRGAKNYRDLVRDGVTDGSIRDEDGVMLFIAVVALSSYFPSAKALYETGTGKKISQKGMTEKYSSFVTGLLSRAMANGQPVAAPVSPPPAPAAATGKARKVAKG